MEHIKIGQLARRTRISVRTLHHYEEIGLLCASGRDAAGRRVYALADLDRLDQIVVLKELGLSLPDIGRCLDDRETLRRLLGGQAQALESSIREQQKKHLQVTSLLERLERLENVPVVSLLRSAPLLKPEWMDEVKEAMRKRVAEVGQEAWQAARKENRELVIEAGDAMRRGWPPDHPDVMALAKRVRQVRLVLTGGDPQFAATLRRMNDEGFARYGEEGGSTDPAVIAYLEQALNASERAGSTSSSSTARLRVGCHSPVTAGGGHET